MPGGSANATLGELQANARLIAAAPDMLEALRRLLDCPALNMDSLEPGDVTAISVARDAIVKATGTNPCEE